MTGGERQRHGELLVRAAGGDGDAFRIFYNETRQVVFRYISSRADRHDAEDLLADTYLRALRFADRYEDRGQPAVAWLMTIARNVVASHHRSRYRAAMVNTGDHRLAATVDEDLIDRSDDAAVLQVLAGLKPRHRQILQFRFFDEMTVAQCADRLSLTEQGVRALTYRALQAMRAKLGDGFLDDGGRVGWTAPAAIDGRDHRAALGQRVGP